MQQQVRLVLVAASVLAAVGGLSSSAGAFARARFDRGGAIVQNSAELISFRGGIATIECGLRLTGELRAAAVIRAPRELPVGTIERVEAAACRGGAIVAFNNRPWNIRVDRIFGPEVNQEDERTPKEQLETMLISLVAGEVGRVNPGITSEVLGLRCEYRANVGLLVELVNAGENRRGGWLYDVERTGFLEGINYIGAFGNPFGCPRVANVEGLLEPLVAARRLIVE